MQVTSNVEKASTVTHCCTHALPALTKWGALMIISAVEAHLVSWGPVKTKQVKMKGSSQPGTWDSSCLCNFLVCM